MPTFVKLKSKEFEAATVELAEPCEEPSSKRQRTEGGPQNLKRVQKPSNRSNFPLILSNT